MIASPRPLAVRQATGGFTVAYVVRAVSPAIRAAQAYVRTCIVQIASSQRRRPPSRSSREVMRPSDREASSAGSLSPCGGGNSPGAWHRVRTLCASVGLRLRGFEHASRPGSTPWPGSTRRNARVLHRRRRFARPAAASYATPDGRWRLPATVKDVDPRYLDLLIAYEDKRSASILVSTRRESAARRCTPHARPHRVGRLDIHDAGRAAARAGARTAPSWPSCARRCARSR